MPDKFSKMQIKYKFYFGISEFQKIHQAIHRMLTYIYARFIELISLILELLFEVLYTLWIQPFASTSQGGRRWLHPPGRALGVQ